MSTIVGPNDGLVQFMGENKCGIGGAKIVNVAVGTTSGGGTSGGGIGPKPDGENMPVSSFGSTSTTISDTIFMYPNPAKTSFTVVLGLNKESEITLFDINSRLMYSTKSFNNKEEIDISNLSNGTYFLKVIGKNSTIKKIIV